MRVIIRFAVVHIDATGTIVCNISLQKQFFYYALLVPQPNKGQAPITVAEFTSSSHSMLTISHFLNTFHYGETKLFGGTTLSAQICHHGQKLSNIWVRSLFLQ